MGFTYHPLNHRLLMSKNLFGTNIVLTAKNLITSIILAIINKCCQFFLLSIFINKKFISLTLLSFNRALTQRR